MGGQPQSCHGVLPTTPQHPGAGGEPAGKGKGGLGQGGQQARITLDTRKGKSENKQTEGVLSQAQGDVCRNGALKHELARAGGVCPVIGTQSRTQRCGAGHWLCCCACLRQKGAGMGNATTKPTCPWTSPEHPSCASATHDCLLPSLPPTVHNWAQPVEKAAPRPGRASVG